MDWIAPVLCTLSSVCVASGTYYVLWWFGGWPTIEAIKSGDPALKIVAVNGALAPIRRYFSGCTQDMQQLSRNLGMSTVPSHLLRIQTDLRPMSSGMPIEDFSRRMQGDTSFNLQGFTGFAALRDNNKKRWYEACT